MQQTITLFVVLVISLLFHIYSIILKKRKTPAFSSTIQRTNKFETLVKVSFPKRKLKTFCAVLDKLVSITPGSSPMVIEIFSHNHKFLKAEADKVWKDSLSIPPLPCYDNHQARILQFIQYYLKNNDYSFVESDFISSMKAHQKKVVFTNNEAHALHFILRYALIQKIFDHVRFTCHEVDKRFTEETISHAIHSLNTLNDIPLHRLAEDSSIIHEHLKQDEIYSKMDAQSRLMYRAKVAHIAKHTHRNERLICETVLLLTKKSQTSDLRSHVGYYLMDEGYPLLLKELNAYDFQPRIMEIICKHTENIQIIFSVSCFLIFLAIGFFCNYPLWLLLPFSLFFLSLIQPYFEHLIQKTSLPKMKIKQLSADTQTLVVCHALLTTADDAIRAVKHLSIMHAANPDEHIHFLLLGEFPSSLTATQSKDDEIIIACSAAIDALCKDTGHRFFYLQRGRFITAGAKTFHSYEGKHGGLDAIINLIHDENTYEEFLFSTFDFEELYQHYPYVLSLNTDITPPPESISALVGIMLHPLNRFCSVSAKPRGYAVVFPTLVPSLSQSATLLSRISPYYHQTNEIALIDTTAYKNLFHKVFPIGRVLHHNIASKHFKYSTTDSAVCFFYRSLSTLQEFSQHFYEYARSACQQLILLLPLKSSHSHRLLGKSGCLELFLFQLHSIKAALQILLMSYAALTNRPLSMIFIFLLPTVSKLCLKHKKTFTGMLLHLSLLPVIAFQQTLGVLTAVNRLLFARQHLQDLHVSSFSPQQSMLDFGLNMGFASFFASCSLIHRSPFPLLQALLWCALPFVSPYLDHTTVTKNIFSDHELNSLFKLCDKIFSYFETVLEASATEFPPEYVRFEPSFEYGDYTTPELMGTYMCSVLAAKKLRIISAFTAANLIADCATTLEVMPHWNGLFYDCYALDNALPKTDAKIQTFSNVLLGVCLLTCAQGLREMLPELGDAFYHLSATLDGLCKRMHFSKLYDQNKKTFFFFYSPQNCIYSETYETPFSEQNLLAYFFSVMMHEVPPNQLHSQKLAKTIKSTTPEALFASIFINPLKPFESTSAYKFSYRKQKIPFIDDGLAKGIQNDHVYSSFHQGIILCSACNLLCNNYFRHLFSSLPQVQAFSRLGNTSLHKH